MRIERLTLRNFRCFEERTIEFGPGFNVLVGDNMTGKTSALDAIAIALTADFGSLGGRPGVRYATTDVRWQFAEGSLSADLCYPSVVLTEFVDDVEAYGWELGIENAGESPVATPHHKRPHLRRLLPLKEPDSVAPVVAFYTPGPVWGRDQPKAATPQIGFRAGGYRNWWQPATAVSDLRNFLASLVGRRLQQPSQPVPWLRAIEQAVAECLPEFDSVSYDFEMRDIVASRPGPPPVREPLFALSDGYRRMLAMVADIARRCCLLNEHLGGRAALDTPGTVLIDELDLHLHPKWQRTVVDSLKRAFPRIQFIATTHSPFIIQSLAPGELISLDDADNEPDYPYAQKSIEDITEWVMGVAKPQRGVRLERLEAQVREFHALLHPNGRGDEARRAEVKAKLDELTLPFAGDPAATALYTFLDAERRAAGLGDPE